MKKEFVPGKLKPEYALINKIIHNQIWPKGNEKSPSQEQIQFLYEVMIGKLIDYALCISHMVRNEGVLTIFACKPAYSVPFTCD